jgi:glucosamine kinase
VAFYLGIDGGGSKTTCAVGDESALLASVTAGPSNVVRVGEAEARNSLHQAVRQACAAAGVTPRQIARVCIGAAGAARPDVAAVVRRMLTEILPVTIDVVGDMEIALQAAFDDGVGVVVIAGTGSIAYGRNPDGATARAGGWGFAISDEGSAHWIGRHAIVAVLREFDAEQGSYHRASQEVGEHDAPLLHALKKAWGVRSLEDLVRGANSTPSPNFAALFPALLAAADAGDKIAQQVLTLAGTELAGLADVVIRRLFTEAGESSRRRSESSAAKTRVRLAMAGGVFRHAPRVRDVFYNRLRGLHRGVELIQQVVTPVEGALRLARSQARNKDAGVGATSNTGAQKVQATKDGPKKAPPKKARSGKPPQGKDRRP